MPFGIDVATRSVCITDPSDVFLIDSVVLDMNKPITFSALAASFARVIAGEQGISLEGAEEGWSFAANTQELAEMIQARAGSGQSVAVQVVTGHADTRPPGCCCAPPGWNDIWAAGPCPVHQGLRRVGSEAPNGSVH